LIICSQWLLRGTAVPLHLVMLSGDSRVSEVSTRSMCMNSLSVCCQYALEKCVSSFLHMGQQEWYKTKHSEYSYTKKCYPARKQTPSPLRDVERLREAICTSVSSTRVASFFVPPSFLTLLVIYSSFPQQFNDNNDGIVAALPIDLSEDFHTVSLLSTLRVMRDWTHT